ncbi:MAG TPA: C25 family cysteine peptidase [Blastocatellia bacterium]|nr:C25 family cysteine peptidase [Blastocatellia bacterium]
MRGHTRLTAREKTFATDVILKRLPGFFLICVVFGLLQPVRAAAQTVTLDSVGSNGAFDNAVGVMSLSWSHNVGSGPNRILVVGVSTSTTSLPPVPPTSRVSSVTYGNASMTRILTQVATDNRSAVEMFQLLNPPTGMSNIVVTLTAAGVNYVVGGSVSFFNVDQTTPFNGTAQTAAASGSPTVSVTSAVGSVVLDTVATLPSGFLAPSSGAQTKQWSGSPFFSFAFDVGAGSTQAGTGPSVTMMWQDVGQPWAIGAVSLKAAVPTEARLSSFTASNDAGRILLAWQTGYEVDNLGFNLYRDDAGKRTRLNRQIIAGSALLAGPGINLRSGHSYAMRDALPASQATQYWLEDVSIDGRSTWHGPITIESSARTPSPPRPAPPAGGPVMLSGLGTAQSSATQPQARAARPPQMRLAAAAEVAAQTELAGRPAVKIAIKREGWYRITQSELVQAGLDAAVDPRRLQMFVDGKPVPISVAGEADGHLDAADTVEFYGVGIDSAATDTRVYWLVAGKQAGQRISLVKAKGSRATPSSFAYTVERRDRTIYFPALRNGERENFFGAVIAHDAVEQTLTVQHLDGTSSAGAQLEVTLQGVTRQTHRVRVDFNGVTAGEVNFDGDTSGVAKITLTASAVKEGDNRVTLVALGGDSDISLVDSIRLTYPHAYAADGDALRFSIASRQQVSVDGFSNPAIRVFDITDTEDVREVREQVQPRGAGYGVTVSGPAGGPRLLLALAEGQGKRVAALTSNQPSSLREPAEGADMIILSHRDFLDRARGLAALRQSQGLGVAVVDVEDVFDEFSFGVKSPQAIKDFLQFARSSWQRPPRFLLLVGGASLDPKNYLGLGDTDFVPTRLLDTASMETASDGWLADFDGDGVEEIAVGRLPVRTPAEAAAVVAKLIAYEQSMPMDGVLLVADANRDFDFAAATERLQGLIPHGLAVESLDENQLGAATVKQRLIEGINQGKKLINYSGHGSVSLWRGDVLTASDAGALANEGRLPLFVMMTCLNGYFHDPGTESLAEGLMKVEHGGAIAVWASSGTTEPSSQAAMNQEFYRQLFGDAGLRLGEAIIKAKTAASNRDTRQTWLLFGDPTMRLK